MKCKYCEFETDNPLSLGGHMTNCKLNPSYKERIKKLSDKGKLRKQSDETRKKISIGRTKYLMNNPDKVPYLLNHSRTESYPEKYFYEIFIEEGLEVEKAYKISLYELDFCIPSKKIDIEIDGDQHYLDNKISDSDIRRNKYLEDRGWDIIRIKWSDYQKMDSINKREYIKNLIDYINGLIDSKPEFNLKEEQQKKCKCGNIIYNHKRNIRCRDCFNLDNRKVERPSLEQILKDIKETNYVLTGKKYGVSDNTIRKWIRQYNADLAETV